MKFLPSLMLCTVVLGISIGAATTPVAGGQDEVKSARRNDAGPPDSSADAGSAADGVGDNYLMFFVRAWDGTVYFAYRWPYVIRRYHLDSQQWLPDIPLTEGPLSLWVDEQGMYVGFGDRVSLIDDLGNETVLFATPWIPNELITIGDVLYVHAAGLVTSLDKHSTAVIDSRQMDRSMTGWDAAPDEGKIVGRDRHYSPEEIVAFDVSSTGVIGPQYQSPYHGHFPGADRCIVLPNQSWVTDDSGTVYLLDDLTYLGSFGGAFTDLAVFQDRLVVARGQSLVAYSTVMHRTGEYVMENESVAIVPWTSNVVSFFEGPSGLATETIPLDAFELPGPAEPVEPNGLKYQPDQIVPGPAGTVLLLSTDHSAVFSWSVTERQYLDSIPLLETPLQIDYSANNQALYIMRDSVEMTAVQRGFGQGWAAERPFFNTPLPAHGFAAADDFVFVCDPTPFDRHYVHDRYGIVLSSDGLGTEPVQDYYWSSANRKVYYMDSPYLDDLRARTVNTDGTLGQITYALSEPGTFGVPIRVHPDGSVLVSAPGHVYDANDLQTYVGSLANSILDAVWRSDHLVTIRQQASSSQLQKWDGSWNEVATRSLEGQPVAITGTDQGVLAIAVRNGKPWFSEWDADLNGLSFSVAVDDGEDWVISGSEIAYTLVITNLKPVTVAGARVEDRFPVLLRDVTWICSATAGSSCGVEQGSGDIDQQVVVAPGGTLTYTITATVEIWASGRLANEASLTESTGDRYTDTDVTTVYQSIDLLFFDAFESGDTSAWSTTVP